MTTTDELGVTSGTDRSSSVVAPEGPAPPWTGRPRGLTVVIPNWNHRGFLPRAIRSARAAVAAVAAIGLPGEVLVIDDCSRDGSTRLLRSLAGLYGWDDVATLFLPENVGLVKVRNIGLGRARFSHTLFLDADNEVLPGGVVMLLRAALATHGAMCYGNLIDVYEGKALGIRSSDVATLRLTFEPYIDALCLVDSEQAISVGGFTRVGELGQWGDWEFAQHLISEERELVFVPTIVGFYNILPLSMLAESSSMEAALRDKRQLERMYSQTGTREWDNQRIGRFYHPELGYLDEGW